MRLKNKVAIVTGSSRGIGRAIALEFAKEGADIVINYIKSKKLANEVAIQIRDIGRKVMIMRADVSNEDEV